MSIHTAVSFFGSQAALAAALKVSPMAVSKWVSGRSRITAERACEIEEVTRGAVTRYDLRPDIFGEPRQGAAA
jgi:DNA-binding transcriptional regulator YdaS (Cro superfamily)